MRKGETAIYTMSFSGLTRESRRQMFVVNSHVKVFKTGQTVLVREIWQGRVWTARPMVLVQDTIEMLALYWVPGTP